MDLLRPKILVIDGRQYRVNSADCYPDDYINETQTDNAEKIPSYVEPDGENVRILINTVHVFLKI